MDFHTLLYQAQKNNTKDKEVKYYKASFDPPKKESKESKQLSDGIKKFLAKKEEEDRQKQLEEKKKKEELLSLRSQDRKSFKRVQSMLNRTKSANKSVIEDAKDDVNTSVTMAGFQQPDEDDYGYASKDAMDIYNKIMNKYVNTPSETKSVTHHRSHDISGTKDRVKAALLKEEEDQLLPHKRKRKPKEVENDDVHHCDTEEPQQKNPKTDNSTEKIKKRPAQPPPLNFQELLKIAEKKQYEPIIIEKPKKEENVPMMTKKEREKYLEEKRIEAMRVARRQGNCLPSTEKPKDVKPVEQMQKPTVSSKIDVNAENKLKKKSSVWSNDLKINKEQNNNYGKIDKYIPKSMSGPDSVRVKSNNSSNRNMSQFSAETNSYEKRYSSNDERYSPKPKTVSGPDSVRVKSNNSSNRNMSQCSAETSLYEKRYSSNDERYSPKPKTVSGPDSVRVKSNHSSNRNMSQSSAEKNSYEKRYSSNDERYSPKPKSVNDQYIPKVKNPVENKYSPQARNSPYSEKYMPKPSSSSIDKYSPKPKSLTPSDKYSCKSNSTEKYVPKPKLSIDEKYVPKQKISIDEKYSSKPKSTIQPERYVPKGNSSSVEKYTPSTKRPDEKYTPKSVSSSSLKLKPTGLKDKYVPTSIDKSKKSLPNNIKPKQFPPRDLMPKQFPPRDLAPKQFPPPDMKRRDDRRMPIRNKRQIIESDSEYDSELDDFIDDGPEDEADYSKVISEIFKYDKSKYRGVDDDDECMESDFRTLQKEEYRSTRAGIMEDLADIRREKAMMKRRKKM